MGEDVVADLARPTRAARGRATAVTFAALDLGTSNCRMMVARATPGGFRVVDSLSRIVSLGEGLAASGHLAPAATDRALEALEECARRFARHGVSAVDGVATEACRQAINGPAFIAQVRDATGLAIRIISPRQEAELIVESCAGLLKGDAFRRALLFDIGGGSTELAWVRLSPGGAAPALIGTSSLPFGVVTLEAIAGADAATDAGFSRLVDLVSAALAPFEAVHRIATEIRAGGVRLLGTSGTVTTLAGEALGLARYRRPLVDGVTLSTAAAVEAACRLRALGRDGLPLHPCVGPERAGLVLAGCAIFEAIRRLWPTPDLLVADRGLREGLLLRLRHARRLASSPVPPARPEIIAAVAITTGAAPAGGLLP